MGICLGVFAYLMLDSIGVALLAVGFFCVLPIFFFPFKEENRYKVLVYSFVGIGFILIVIALPFTYRDWDSKISGRDLRPSYLSRDLHILNKSTYGGMPELSKAIHNDIKAKMEDKEEALKYHLFTRTNETNLLVLIKIPELKKYDGETRESLMEWVEDFIEQKTEFSNFALYIGLQGEFLIGAISTPEKKEVEYSFQINMDLYPFYSSLPIFKRK